MKIDVQNFNEIRYIDVKAGTVFQFNGDSSFYMAIESINTNYPFKGHVDLKTGIFYQFEQCVWGTAMVTVISNATLVNRR